MAIAATYCTHKELKRVFPQLDSFDGKRQIFGFVETSSNLWSSHDSGLVDTLFIDGEEEIAQANLLALNVQNEWYYNAATNVLHIYSTTDPNDKLIEAGEDFATVVAQFISDASRYLDSMLDPNMPKEALKDKEGNFDYIIIRSSALIAANFMIKSHDPNSELANALMEEAEKNISNINEGKAALSWQVTRDSSQGIIRDVSYIAPYMRPVDTRGEWTGTYDLIKVIITEAGQLGAAKYSVSVKGSTKLKENEIITDKIITGDYQALAGGLQIRFAGTDSDTVAYNTHEWEIEVFGRHETVDASSGKAVKMTRTRKI